MNKQLTEAQRRVEEITTRLEDVLGLSSWWEIKHKFNEGQDGETAIGAEGPLVHRTTACTVSQWEYRTCEITWYLPSVAASDDERLRKVAVHEYVHMLNAPLGQFLFDYLRDDETATEQLRSIGQHSRLEEFVTETLSRIIVRALDTPC